ncbi:hypothetical protein [Halobellus salinisoli]|uniref:hypothetical protein n=1 Tax=Halobellus salinisoli TaxID=3108500 RepID=UPI00300A4D42
MGTAEEQVGGIGLRPPGIRRHHVWFAISFGAGAAILPPTGAQTIAGWVGGVVGSFVAAILILVVSLFAVRSLDEWRPPTESREGVPDTHVIKAVFLLICVQLFVFGTQISVDLGPRAIVYLLAPLNVLVSGTILWDMYSLSGQGIEWDSTDYGYAALALLVGFAGGFGYWYRRGRARSAWFDARESETEADGDDAEAETGDVSEGTDEVTASAASEAESASGESTETSTEQPDAASGRDEASATERSDPTTASAEQDDTDVDDRE